MSKMYICPKAKECGDALDCYHNKPHEHLPVSCGIGKNIIQDCPACIPYIPEPAEMPLIDTPLLPYISANQAFNIAKENQRDADMAWLPAHDTEVAAKAVKEFAEKVMRDLPDFRGREKFCNHIRAMAEEK